MDRRTELQSTVRAGLAVGAVGRLGLRVEGEKKVGRIS